MANKKYKYVGNHAQDLPGGRVVAPGEGNIEETDENKTVLQQMFNEGLLLEEDEQEAAVATEAATKLAQKKSITLGSVKGTGKDGIITVEDVEAAAAAGSEGEEE